MPKKKTLDPGSLQKEDFKELIFNPHIEPEELIDILQKEANITVDPDLSREEMLEIVWEEFCKIRAAYQEEIKKQRSDNELIKRKPKSQTSSGVKVSRKEFIVNLIKEGKYTKASILQKVSDEFNYAQEGKTPNTRVSKVIKEMKEKGLLETSADGVLSLK